MISSLDGSATGADGLSGSLHTPADGHIFAAQRALADAVVVGAQTVRAEGYARLGPERGQTTAAALVVVSGSGSLPPSLNTSSGGGRAVLATVTSAPARRLAHARRILGDDSVWLLGDRQVDLPALRERVSAQGWRRVLCEGGPSLLAQLYAARLVDEASVTIVPRVVSGDGPRITAGPPADTPLRQEVLLEEGGTLLSLWSVQH